MPEGADAVIQIEDVVRLSGGASPSGHATAVDLSASSAAVPGAPPQVRILKAAKPGQDIRPVGSDIA